MKVPCIKGYELTERDFRPDIAIIRNWVSIYNDICDSCDLCRNKTCAFYDDTVEGTRKYLEGSHKVRSSVKEILKDKKNRRSFLEFYGFQD